MNMVHPSFREFLLAFETAQSYRALSGSGNADYEPALDRPCETISVAG